MKIRPIGNRVVLKPVEKSQTKDGILIPDAIKEKPMHFIVLSIGEGWINNDGTVIPITNIKVGDHVLTQKHAGLEIKNDDGQIVRMIDARQILAVLQD